MQNYKEKIKKEMQETGIVNGDCWVACIDILGFKNHVLDFEQKYGKGHFDIFVQNYYKDILDELEKRGKYWPGKVSIWWASDTFVFYTLDDSAESFTCIEQEVTHFCAGLSWKRYAFRGALAVGQLYAEPGQNILVGPSFIDAYEYAEKQNWIGLVLTPSAYTKLQVLGLDPANMPLMFAEYDVPIKKKEMTTTQSTEKLFAARFGRYPMVQKCIKQMQSKCKVRYPEEYENHHKSKYENTLNFICDTGNHFSVTPSVATNNKRKISMSKAHVYKRDHINTDEIIPARYLNTDEEAELAKHCLEDLDKGFVSKVQAGDIIVAGEDFGCGSSREHAVWAIRGAGVQTVIAKSFARIFYRNAINNGFYLIESPDGLEKISDGDELEIDYKAGLIKNKTADVDIKFKPLPEFALEIINDGGLLEHITKRTTD
jgi:3-isopropylmalate/(R)-2-methylmalate dehydratase small subunit